MLARIGEADEGWIALTKGVVGEGWALYRAVVDADLGRDRGHGARNLRPRHLHALENAAFPRHTHGTFGWVC